MNIPQFAQIGAIVLIAFFVGEVVKRTPLDEKWIPVICGCVGAVFGIIGRSVIPELADANWINALAMGISSGLAATGMHQVYKQLSDNENPKHNDTQNEDMPELLDDRE